MPAAPALDLTKDPVESIPAEATTESGEFLIERTFAEKGLEGLAELASKDIVKAVDRVKMLAEVPAEVAQTAMDAVTQLKAIKEKAEAELLASKKKLFLAMGKDTDLDQARASLEPLKAEVARRSADLSVAEAGTEVPTRKVEEDVLKTVKVEDEDGVSEPIASITEEVHAPVVEDEALPLTQMKGIPLPEASNEEMILESNLVEGAEEASVLEVPPGRMDAQEELVIPQVSESAVSIDWELLAKEELAKKESAETDYQEAQKALYEFKKQRPVKLLPIEQKYVLALEAQLEMDRLASAHAENQLALFEVNKNIEVLGSTEDTEGELYKLIEQRNAKDLHSRNLVTQYEEATGLHDKVLEEYETSLEDFSENAEPVQEVVMEESEESNVDTELSTGGSYVGADFEKRKLFLTPEDEANFEARRAGVGIESPKKPGLFSKASKQAKETTGFFKEQASSTVNPGMGPSVESGGGEKKKKGVLTWLFSDRWLPWGKK